MWGRIISTHALTEGDGIVSGLASTGAFQLTPSWRATKTDCSCNSSGHISTHALTEGDDQLFCNAEFSLISTHALTEGDAVRILHLPVPSYFNSRPHGGRRSGYVSLTIPLYFNSRPHGGRPSGTRILFSCAKFQLTPSRRATGYPLILVFCQSKFQLTPSRRATVFAILIHIFTTIISTHALTEGDQQSSGAFVDLAVFQLTPSRRATSAPFCTVPTGYFNSRPHGGRPQASWGC